MHKVNNNNLLTKKCHIRLGSLKMAHLLFSLVHLILCYALRKYFYEKDNNNNFITNLYSL